MADDDVTMLESPPACGPGPDATVLEPPELTSTELAPTEVATAELTSTELASAERMMAGAAGQAPAAVVPGELPADLRDRWEQLSRLASGGEAVLFRVRSRTGDDAGLVRRRDGQAPERVLKLYAARDDAGRETRRTVWATLRSARNQHLMPLLATGTSADGYDWELQRYYPDGTVEDIVSRSLNGVRETFTAWPPDRVERLVRQVTQALGALHAAAVLHRDVKPANILVAQAEPLEVVLGDFGISAPLERGGRYAAAVGSSRFLAPESHVAGRVWDSPARDWWALGLVVLELSSGVRPFLGYDEDARRGEIVRRGADVSVVRDPRLRLLCRGLLTRDHEHRWGRDQVESWLDRRPVEVLDPEPADDRLVLGDLTFSHPDELAAAIAGDVRIWDAAARRFLPVPSPGGDNGEGWRQLTTWLRATRTRTRAGAGGGGGRAWTEDDLAELLDHRLRRTDLSPDVRVLHLVRWLAPDRPVSFRGRQLTMESLSAMADAARSQIALEQPGWERQLVAHLWRDGVLDLLAAPAGAAADLAAVNFAAVNFAAVAPRWHLAESQLPGRVRALGPPRRRIRTRPAWLAEWSVAVGLWLAVDPADVSARLDALIQTETAALGRWAPSWWTTTGQRVGDSAPHVRRRDADPRTERQVRRGIDLAACMLHLPAAVAETDSARDEDNRRRTAAQGRREAWDRAEADRLAAGRRTRVRIVRHLAPWLLATVLLLALNLRLFGELPLWMVYFVVAAVVVGAHAFREAGLAEDLAGDYGQPLDSADEAGRLNLRADRWRQAADWFWRPSWMQTIAAGLGALAVAGVAGAVLLFLPPVLHVIEIYVLSQGVTDRRDRWRAAHDERRRRTLGWQPALTFRPSRNVIRIHRSESGEL